MSKEMVLVDDKGKRIDGRTSEESREIKIEAGVLKNADGSAYVEIGKNKVLAAVYGPRECHPRHLQNPTKAIVQCKYNMQAYSVDDRKRPGTDRRSIEISKIVSEALEKTGYRQKIHRNFQNSIGSFGKCCAYRALPPGIH